MVKSVYHCIPNFEPSESCMSCGKRETREDVFAQTCIFNL